MFGDLTDIVNGNRPPEDVPPPPPTGNPGGSAGDIMDIINGTRPPTSTPVKDQTPPGGVITGPTYEEQQAAYAEQLAAAQAAQKAAYEEQLRQQQAQYEQQRQAEQAAYEQRQADAAAARQAEIDRRNAEALAKKEANNASWANANAAAAGVASSAPSYTKKYGEGSNAGGLLSGVNSVRGNSAAVKAPGPVSGMMKKWME
jgi:hypothetical protein